MVVYLKIKIQDIYNRIKLQENIMGSSLTTSNIFKENKINVNDTLVELESVDKGEEILSWNFDTNKIETTIVTDKQVSVSEDAEVFYLRCGSDVVSLTAFHKVPVFIDGGDKEEIAISELLEKENVSVVTPDGIRGGIIQQADDNTGGTDVVTLKTEFGYYFSNNILICD